MNKRRLKIILVIATIIILFNCNLSFAGMADFDDNDAKIETNRLLEQQEKDEKDSIGKSTNNYLESLEVKEYKIEPNFDKQTQEYSISTEIEEDSIEIIATADDSRATVQGDGKVTLKSGENKLRVDVEAENGAVRTYIIKVIKLGDVAPEENINNNIQNETIDTSAIQQEDNSMQLEEKNTNNIIIVILVLILIVIILCIINKKSSKKKNKHHK